LTDSNSQLPTPKIVGKLFNPEIYYDHQTLKKLRKKTKNHSSENPSYELIMIMIIYLQVKKQAEIGESWRL